MIRYMTPSSLRPEHFRVQQTDRPGWVWGTTRLPLVGEAIFCAAGLGTVRAMHGRTGDGSRLVEIAFAGVRPQPFFAAASNVLLAPPGTPPMEAEPTPAALLSLREAPLADDPEEWLGRWPTTPPLR